MDTKFLEPADEHFLEKAEQALQELFDVAQAKNEVHFALALNSEMRGIGRVRTTVMETFAAFDEYVDFLNNGDGSHFKVRIALSFYSHLSEASGLYEVPKNMLRIASGERHLITPFGHLERRHSVTGEKIAPNVNKVFKDLIGHSSELGFTELAEVFRDAFNPQLRNAYAHADFIILDDRIRVDWRLGKAIDIPYATFDQQFRRGIGFFQVLRTMINKSVVSYDPPKTVIGRVGDEQEGSVTIGFDPKTKTFSLSGTARY